MSSTQDQRHQSILKVTSRQTLELDPKSRCRHPSVPTSFPDTSSPFLEPPPYLPPATCHLPPPPSISSPSSPNPMHPICRTIYPNEMTLHIRCSMWPLAGPVLGLTQAISSLRRVSGEISTSVRLSAHIRLLGGHISPQTAKTIE